MWILKQSSAWVRLFSSAFVKSLNALQAPATWLARAYVAQAFFLSGLTKIQDWDNTLYLFQEEYHVPFFSPAWAALMGTTGELVLPVLLILGLGTRFAALGLSVVNVMAVLSLAEMAPAAFQQHVFWGSLLVGVAVFGPGAWSLDGWCCKRGFCGFVAKH